MIDPSIVEKMYSVDDFDYSDLLSESNSEKIKVCLICQKQFVSIGRNSDRQKYCKRSHYLDCPICGKPILQDLSTGSAKQSCSRECGIKLKALRTKEAMLEKYGVENVSQVPEIHAKQVASIKAKAVETNKKAKATLEAKYGGMGAASPQIRAKIEATMKERYGDSNPAKNDAIRKKISEACRSPEYQAKYAQTALANWGVDRPSKTKAVQQKIKETNLERYGVECTLQREDVKEKLKQSNLEKYGVENALFSDYGKEQARQGYLQHMREGNNKISKLNQQIAEAMQEMYGIETEFEYIIKGKWYDLKLKDSNIVLEIDPSYTHSDLPNHWSAEGLPPDYHLMKSTIAEENGYRCIHVFDWDNLDKIAKMLKSKQLLYARNCDLISLTEKEASEFIDLYHLQGKTRGTQYAYGLKYNGEIVEVMTFGKPRYNKNYQWELLRLCTDSTYKVIGGASRLLQAFVKEVEPDSILSYCDKAKFNGKVYEELGFSLDHISPPSKIWSRGNEHITDNLLRMRGYDQLFNTNYGKGTSNEELMITDGWRSVYDCGQMVFVWRMTTDRILI